MIRKGSLVVLLAFVVMLAAGLAWPTLADAQPAQKAASEGKININTASKAELTKLEGVGPVLADKILEYRKANGPFKRPEDIRKIQGFGKGLWEKNRDAITVE